MMVPKKSLILASAALLFAGAASAQTQGQKSSFRRYTGPLNTVNLDLESGVITRGPVVNDRAASTVSVFNNNDLGGFVGVDTGNCGCEWYDAGVKSTTMGESSYVSGFIFAYCSAAADPISGGPGGTAQLFFNQGYTNGSATPNNPGVSTDVARVTVTGLPANTGNSSFFGGFRCFFITIGFGQTFCLPDGNIGYGWKFMDQGTPGVLAQTWPFLSCVQSCTGTGPDGLGMVDQVNQFCPPGFLLSTFTFGAGYPGGYFTSISMDIREALSTGSFTSAQFPQPLITPSITLTDNAGGIGQGPNIGDPANAYGVLLNCTPASINGLFRIDIRPGIVPAGLPTGFQGTLLYATGPVLAKFSGGHTMNSVATPSIPLPKDLTFACLPYTNQGWCQDAPVGFLSSALRETIGIP
jgi:hypothetical protein